MELNYQNVDNRGFNSNFNPDQSLDLPYSPKSRNKVNANKSHYEEERRPGAIVDKNAAYFANLRKLEKINAEEKLARLNPKDRKKQQDIEEQNRRHEEERVNKLSKLGSVFARGPGARPQPPGNNRSVLTITPRPEKLENRPESRSLSPTVRTTNAQQTSRPESRSLNTISPNRRPYQNNNDDYEQLLEFGDAYTVISPRSVSLGSRIFSFFSSSSKSNKR